MTIYAPNTYWDSPENIKKEITNGCGAKGGVNVPDTMWGLDISQACNIHDWMFNEGKSLSDFYFSNAVFIMNLTLIITSVGSKYLAPLRLARAAKYFIAVQELGQDAFWADKPRNNDLAINYKGSFRCVEC